MPNCASGPHQKRAAHALPYLHLRAGLFEIRDASDHTCGIKVGSATPKSQAGCDAGGDSKVFGPHAFTVAALGPALQSALMKDSKASTATLLGRLEDFFGRFGPYWKWHAVCARPCQIQFWTLPEVRKLSSRHACPWGTLPKVDRTPPKPQRKRQSRT